MNMLEKSAEDEFPSDIIFTLETFDTFDIIKCNHLLICNM